MEERPFWIIWCEDGPTPPKIKHYSEAAANMVAKEMAKKHGKGLVFHVMRSERCFQQQTRTECFATGSTEWTRAS